MASRSPSPAPPRPLRPTPTHFSSSVVIPPPLPSPSSSSPSTTVVTNSPTHWKQQQQQLGYGYGYGGGPAPPPMPQASMFVTPNPSPYPSPPATPQHTPLNSPYTSPFASPPSSPCTSPVPSPTLMCGSPLMSPMSSPPLSRHDSPRTSWGGEASLSSSYSPPPSPFAAHRQQQQQQQQQQQPTFMSGPDIQPSSSLSASLSPPSTLPSLSTAAAAATQSLSLARVSPKEDSTARWARELISSQQQLYELGNEIGRGAYGIVFSGVCLQTREPVAIKLIEGCCENENESRRYIREIKIMKYFAHSTHVLGLIDIFPLSEGNQKFAHIKNTRGLVSELMDCDLRTLIYDRGPISSEQCRIIMYGILCGAHEIHSACIVHRDLRPKNILIKGNRVKICDFGLARGQSHRMSLLSNLSHQWYTAPEGLFNNNCYTTAVDVWSLGCIFAEMLTNQILFKGESRLVRQVEKIFQVLGTPNEETINRICGKHERWLAQIQELPLYPVTPLETHFPSAPPDGIHLLQMMLVVNPAERITTTAALSHPYFTGVANLATDEKPLKPAPVDVPSIATSPKILKDMLYQECHTVGPVSSMGFRSRTSPSCWSPSPSLSHS